MELEKWEQTLHECPWRPTKGAAPCAVKVARTVQNGGDEETYRKATRLVPTQREGGRSEFARDEDGDGFCEVHVNTMEGFWSLLRSWLRPHRGISQEKLPLYLGFFEFVHNVRKRGKALLGSLIELLVSKDPGSQ